jgi:hypothetical protein
MSLPGSTPHRSFGLRIPELGPGWLGVMMVGAGLGTVWLAPPRPAAPALARLAFLPPRGPAGIRVLLEGEGVQAARTVKFGAAQAVFRTVGEGRIEARVPEGADSAPITLVTDTGRTYTSADAFQVLPGRPGPPAVARFWPAAGPPGTEVSLTGTGLQEVEGVTVAGRPAEFIPVSDTALVVKVPRGLGGPGPIAVASPFGTGVTGRAYRPAMTVVYP